MFESMDFFLVGCFFFFFSSEGDAAASCFAFVDLPDAMFWFWYVRDAR